MIWNEPNNKSHWDLLLDPEWDRFSAMARLAGQAIRAEAPDLPRVLGGISPIDPSFIGRLAAKGVMDEIDVVAVHGFPLDWNLWMIDEWPAKLEEIRAVADKPIWATEVGVSSFGADEVQAWGVRRTAELLIGKAPRIHWYSLYDLPRTWEATTRHKEAEGSSYYRHFTWGCCARTARPSLRSTPTRRMPRRWGFANGSISRTTGWRMRWPGCAAWACGICAPASPGPTAFGRERWPGSTARCGRSQTSR